MHVRNVQTEMQIEMHKVANGISLEIMNQIFQSRGELHYNLRYASELFIPTIHNFYQGSESLSYLECKIWELIPPVTRQVDFLSGFKKIKNGSLVTA